MTEFKHRYYAHLIFRFFAGIGYLNMPCQTPKMDLYFDNFRSRTAVR